MKLITAIMFVSSVAMADTSVQVLGQTGVTGGIGPNGPTGPTGSPGVAMGASSLFALPQAATLIANGNPLGVATGDFNGDTFPDVAFAAKVDYGTGTGPTSVAAVDVSGDGCPDILTANYTVNTVSVLLGNKVGTCLGTFAAKTDYATGTTPHGIVVVDVNGDGCPDAITADYGSDTISVLLNACNGTGALGRCDGARGFWPPVVSRNWRRGRKWMRRHCRPDAKHSDAKSLGPVVVGQVLTVTSSLANDVAPVVATCAPSP
jgi:hypothetical protein